MILLIITLLILTLELVTFLVYGFFINKHESEILMNIPEKDIKFNIFDTSILSLPDQYISKNPFNLLSKYHIGSIYNDNIKGTVLRWSKLHRKINYYYKIAR